MTKRNRRESAAELIPDRPTIPKVPADARNCQACDLHKLGTQTAFGEGDRKAPLMLIGEQPGDLEDLSGRPFVGPAGKLLDRALAEAGIRREAIYLTNAVKHFKWKATGGDDEGPVRKRRLHDKPNAAEMRACGPWLEREL